MIKTLKCTLKPIEKHYEIEIAPFISEEISKLAKELNSIAKRFVLITDSSLKEKFGIPLEEKLRAKGLDIRLLDFPSGEQHKTRETKSNLEDELLKRAYGKDTCLMAFGGGVVTDLVGFLASTYCRGVSFIMIPTTLLAMVDASIGGKTGVDVPEGKNLIGALYHPKKVFIDPLFLTHLPSKELQNGLIEIIKIALVSDLIFFEMLEKNIEDILKKKASLIESLIVRSIQLKIAIVEEDEHEYGKRFLLNFGHTVGHALEKLSLYTISHGQAVAIGILVESYIAVKLKKLKKTSFDRIYNLFMRYLLSTNFFFKFSEETIVEAMTLDKKSLQGKPRFVILKELGEPFDCDGNFCTHVDDSILKEALAWMKKLLSKG